MNILNRLNAALEWRLRVAGDIRRKWYWRIKRAFDFGKKEKPKGISVVVVGRNDNYGGDFTKRLQVTIDWNLKQLPDAELIYVEWNRIADRPSDCEWVAERYPNAKCYSVPTSIHEKICTAQKGMPMMEYHAKNIGMRKASNEWVILINADCFLGYDAINRIKNGKLDPKKIYGTHYTNIDWDGAALEDRHVTDKKIQLHIWGVNAFMAAVMGNFLMARKDRLEEATGYDERLTDVRDGVDNNGYRQFLHHGLKPMVLGTHFHLDHGDSRIYGLNATHGNTESERLRTNIPYKNPDDWGFVNYPLKEISKNFWELQPN